MSAEDRAQRKEQRSAVRKRTTELRSAYEAWKSWGLKKSGWFPVFNGFKHKHLKELSGNALRLYLYFGLHGKRATGESWHDIDTIADFFDKSPRAIKLWIKELEESGLIERLQMSPNGVAFTYLVPYEHAKLMPSDESEELDEDTIAVIESALPSDKHKDPNEMLREFMEWFRSLKNETVDAKTEDESTPIDL